MFEVISKSVRIGLVFVIVGVLFTLFNVWWFGLLDVYPLLVCVYLMTFISITPYIFVNVILSLRNRDDSRWIVTLGLSIALFSSLVAALVKLGQLRAVITPFVVSQLKFDSTLALSLALLGLSTLVYINSVVPEGRRLAAVVFKVVDGEDDGVETI